jgi:hypothetical protein
MENPWEEVPRGKEDLNRRKRNYVLSLSFNKKRKKYL